MKEQNLSVTLAARLDKLRAEHELLSAKIAADETRRSELLRGDDDAALAKADAALAADRARLATLGERITVLEAVHAAAVAEEGRLADERRAAALRKKSSALAGRIGDVAGQALALIEGLARDLGEVEAGIAALAGKVAEPIISPDMIARGLPARERQIVAEKRVSMWTFEASGEIVGRQAAVVSRDGRTGILPGGAFAPNVRVVLRNFVRREVLPELRASFPNPPALHALEIAAAALRELGKRATVQAETLVEWEPIAEPESEGASPAAA